MGDRKGARTMTDTQAWILVVEVGVIALGALRALIGK
jgi:hypothetical protein